MPQVIITLTDTPVGGVSVHTDYKPAIGARCTLAQSAALDIVSRTRKHYDLQDPLPVAPGVDIDQTHLAKSNYSRAEEPRCSADER